MSRYPGAEFVQWKYNSGEGPTYYKGTNRPSAVVLHRMQGWMRTARAWALAGHYGASWHYSIGLDGSVMQHLDHEDGGYHAGVADTQTAVRPPTWPLWKGPGVNVNSYTIGVEMEGFAAQEHPLEQLVALKALCEWLSVDLGGIPYVRERFPAHAEIDTVNRVNDFNTPAIREEVYRYLFNEEDALKLTETQTENLLLRVFAGSEFEGVESREQRLQRALGELDKAETVQSVNDTAASASVVALATEKAFNDHETNHPGGGGLTDHKHHYDAPQTTGGVIKQGV